MSATFEIHDRVEYVADGPQAHLRGVHGSVHAVHTLDSGATVADVMFDGHTALWAIPTKHLAPLAEAVTTPAFVQLDREEEQRERTQAYQRVMGAALEWEYAEAYPTSPAAMDATEALDALRTAIRAYKAVAR